MADSKKPTKSRPTEPTEPTELSVPAEATADAVTPDEAGDPPMSRAERRAAGKKKQTANPSGAPHGTAKINPGRGYGPPGTSRQYASRRSG
jgi:hypothetical protein